MVLYSFEKKLENSNIKHQSSSSFICNDFAQFYAKHRDKIQDTVLFDLLQHMINVLKGNLRAKLGKRTMNFFMMIGTSSPQASRYCATNIFGPNIRNMRKHYKKVDMMYSPESTTIISRSKKDVEEAFIDHM